MKPWIHAQSSAKKFGGEPDDYLEIHQFMDMSKAAMADVRHRAIFHSAFGCFIVEHVFGSTMENSEGKIISVRDIAEQHIVEDLGFIPSMQDWLQGLRIQPWMSGKRGPKKQHIPLEESKTVNTTFEEYKGEIVYHEANTD